MMTTAGVVTMGGVATTVAGDILAGVITMGGGILAGGTVGGTTNPRELTFARVCQRSDVSLVPYSLGSCLGVARRPVRKPNVDFPFWLRLFRSRNVHRKLNCWIGVRPSG